MDYMTYFGKLGDIEAAAYDAMSEEEKKIYEDRFETFEDLNPEDVRRMSDAELSAVIGVAVTPRLRAAIEASTAVFTEISELVDYAQDLPEEEPDDYDWGRRVPLQ